MTMGSINPYLSLSGFLFLCANLIIAYNAYYNGFREGLETVLVFLR